MTKCSECNIESQDGSSHKSTCSQAKRDPLTGRAIPQLSELNNEDYGRDPCGHAIEIWELKDY